MLTWKTCGTLESWHDNEQGTSNIEFFDRREVELLKRTRLSPDDVEDVEDVEDVIMNVLPNIVSPIRVHTSSAPHTAHSSIVMNGTEELRASGDLSMPDAREDMPPAAEAEGEPTTPTTHSQINLLFDERRRALHCDAEKRAQQEHVQRLRKKRSLQETIDECLSADTEMHHKATGLRLAFEAETELWQAKIKEASRHLITGMSKEYSSELETGSSSSSSGDSRRMGEHMEISMDSEASAFIYNFDEHGQPWEPPANTLYHPHSAMTTRESFAQGTDQFIWNSGTCRAQHPCGAMNVGGTQTDTQLHVPLPPQVAAVSPDPDVQASKRIRRFVSPVKASQPASCD